MQADSLCALGQLTPGPVMAALRFFEEEFVDHIDDKTCPAGQCKSLVRAKCINACPADVDIAGLPGAGRRRAGTPRAWPSTASATRSR